MTPSAPDRSLGYRVVAFFASKRLVAALLARVLFIIDRPILRWSRGRYSVTSLVTGLPIVVLKTKGAKSGTLYETPLVGIVENDRVVLIASYFGSKRNPGWYYNLRANAKATVVVDGEEAAYVAREAQDAEREMYWAKATAIYAGYAAYRKWVKNRRIPIVILDKQEKRTT
jgi:deazaflavin-dependent oxidoreductase (nitroreductase family)